MEFGLPNQQYDSNYANQVSSAKAFSNNASDHWNTVSKGLSAVNPMLGAVSTLGQLAYGYYGGKDQLKEQKKARNEQQQFQERMSSTAHQRQVLDLRRAGLNPILSSKLGGSSTPTGSTFNPENRALRMAQISQHISTARKLQNEVTMQDMDIAMMKRRGLSPMAFKHTPFNQLGSEFLKTGHPFGQFLRGELLTNIMNSASAKHMKQKVLDIMKKIRKPTVTIRNFGENLW